MFSSQNFQRWLVTDKGGSSISCLESYALNGSATKHLIAGRHDGYIEIYQVNLHDHLDIPKLIFKYASIRLN